MSNDIGVARKRLEEYKKELFEGDKDILMFKDRAAKIREKNELDITPDPPSTESIIEEIRRNRGNQTRRSD